MCTTRIMRAHPPLDSSATGSELMRPTRCSRSSPSVAIEPFDGDGWLFELKLGGFRGLADTVHGRVLSKNGNRMRRFSGNYIANGQRGLSGLKSMWCITPMIRAGRHAAYMTCQPESLRGGLQPHLISHAVLCGMSIAKDPAGSPAGVALVMHLNGSRPVMPAYLPVPPVMI